MREVRDDRECRIMILRGAGETFCAGDDIKEFNEWKRDDAYWQVRLYQETVQIIEDLTPVTIAAVDGVCTGGGLELTLVCDFVIEATLPILHMSPLGVFPVHCACARGNMSSNAPHRRG